VLEPTTAVCPSIFPFFSLSNDVLINALLIISRGCKLLCSKCDISLWRGRLQSVMYWCLLWYHIPSGLAIKSMTFSQGPHCGTLFILPCILRSSHSPDNICWQTYELGPDWLGTKFAKPKWGHAQYFFGDCALTLNQLDAKILAATFSTQTSATFTQILVEFFLACTCFGMPQFWPAPATFGSQPINVYGFAGFERIRCLRGGELGSYIFLHK